MHRPDIQFISKHLIVNHGTTQIRCLQPAEALRDAGYSVMVNTIYETTPKARKLIVLHRAVLDTYTHNFIVCAQARGIPLIYDTDDLLFDSDGIEYLLKGTNAQNYVSSGWKRYSSVMAMCDAVTVSTEFLAARAENVNPNTHVILNALSENYLQNADEVTKQRNKEIRKGVTMAYLSGSRSHDTDFATIEDALVGILRKHLSTRLLLVGPLEISHKFAEFGNRVVRLAFKPYSEFPTIFNEIDINLIPLEIAQAFCHAKSELKFIEAAACGVVSIASPTDPYKAAIEHRKNGILAKNDWRICLEELVEDSTLRKRLGSEARNYVKSEYTPEQCRQAWDKVISTVLGEYTAKPVNSKKYSMNFTKMYFKLWYCKLRIWANQIRSG